MEFRWTVGFEGSFIPHLGIDQYQWTQHDRCWREDFALVAGDLGCRWARYPVPWHILEPEAGSFHWSWFDERLELAESLGLELIVDLVHFGTPTWLADAFGDSEFPAAVERFARAFGKRYKGRIRHICPLNEPLTTAIFAGEFGLWPPHGRGPGDYCAVLASMALGTVRAIQALREEMPDVEIMITDAVECPVTHDEACRENVSHRLERRMLALDLIMGRVNSDHALAAWLREHGFSRFDLQWLERNGVRPDILGLDYYPHSEVMVERTAEGHLHQSVPAQPCGLFRAARDYWNRYEIPLMITETSIPGGFEDRGWWLEYTTWEVRRLRAEGIPVVGYTWWPIIDHLDWDGALLHRTGHIHPVGIYSLQRGENGRLDRARGPLRDAYRALIARGNEAVGPQAERAEAAKPQALESISGAPKRNKEMSQTVSTPPGRNNSSSTNFPIVVHCHLRWDWVWQRPQQFLSRLSKNHPILFVEGPELHDGEFTPHYTTETAPNFPNVTILKTHFPHTRFDDGAWVDSQRYELVRDAICSDTKRVFENAVHWFYDPMAAPCFIGKLDEAAIVYDCMDQLSQFKFAPPALVEREQTLLRAADVVFAGGRKMWEDKRRYNSNAHFYGCGVDVPHFAKARAEETAIPHDIDFLSRPILGYFGVVDERLDYDLIAHLADTHPHWNIAMVGPVCKVDPNHLPRRQNIFWLGGRDYSELPAYTKAFDVCMMPFAMNEATEFINPTKALEYMAAGKPIVSTPVPDVVSNFGHVAVVAKTAEEFADACAQALAERDEAAIERGLKMADDNTWDSIVAKMEAHITVAIAARAARSDKALREAHRVKSRAALAA